MNPIVGLSTERSIKKNLLVLEDNTVKGLLKEESWKLGDSEKVLMPSSHEIQPLEAQRDPKTSAAALSEYKKKIFELAFDSKHRIRRLSSEISPKHRLFEVHASTKSNSKQHSLQTTPIASKPETFRSLHYIVDEDALEEGLHGLEEEEALDRVEVSFSSETFYTVFAVYLAFYAALGPLAYFAVLFKPKLRHVFSNLQLLCFSRKCAGHLLVWAAFFSTVFIYLRQLRGALEDRSSSVEMTVLKTAATGVILFSAISAARVATIPKRLSKQAQQVLMDSRQRSNECMLGKWQRQERGAVEREICNSVERRDLDFSTFKVSFMADLNHRVVASIEALASQRTNRATANWLQHYSMNQRELCYFRSDYLLEFLVSEFNRSRSLKVESVVAVLLCFLWSLDSGVLRYIFGEDLQGASWTGLCAFYSQVLVSGSISTL